MKAWSVIGLLSGTAILATIPISPQATLRGVELRIDQAQAQNTYERYRQVTRPAYRAAPGWVPKYGPPIPTYPGGYYQPFPPIGTYPGGYYRPYYPYPGHDVPRWDGFYFGDFYTNG